jgi:hypothetical protein
MAKLAGGARVRIGRTHPDGRPRDTPARARIRADGQDLPGDSPQPTDISRRTEGAP